MKDINSMSLVELAIEIQLESNEKTTFIDLYKKVCDAKEMSDDERKANIAQFYTDITACGDFVYCGDDLWDLKKNQKLEVLDSEYYQEHIADEYDEDEEIIKKPRKKSSKKIKYIEELEDEDEDKEENLDSNDEDYENVSFDDYDESQDDDYSSYEKDLDSELDEDDDDKSYDEDEEEDDFDEDKYNSIMDEYENQYDD